jgi:Dolichyl-phosphate-mannose-protein mannosyltransferase
MFNKLRKISWHHFLFWTSLIVVTILLHFDHSLNSDEGVTLNGAWNLFNNRQLYIDFYEIIPPGSFFIFFFIWKIFGVSFLSAKIVSIIFLVFGIVGLCKIGQLITKNNVVIFLILLAFIFMSCWWPLINHNALNLTFLIWACYFFIRGLNGLKNN